VKKKGKTTDAKAIVKALETQGTELILGYPGRTNLPFYEKLARAPFPQILARHKQGGGREATPLAQPPG
jgi:acetolactate synthase-1/2/3 large subunit